MKRILCLPEGFWRSSGFWTIPRPAPDLSSFFLPIGMDERARNDCHSGAVYPKINSPMVALALQNGKLQLTGNSGLLQGATQVDDGSTSST